jgi:hypothetical protein
MIPHIPGAVPAPHTDLIGCPFYPLDAGPASPQCTVTYTGVCEI